VETLVVLSSLRVLSIIVSELFSESQNSLKKNQKSVNYIEVLQMGGGEGMITLQRTALRCFSLWPFPLVAFANSTRSLGTIFSSLASYRDGQSQSGRKVAGTLRCSQTRCPEGTSFSFLSQVILCTFLATFAFANSELPRLLLLSPTIFTFGNFRS